MPDKRDETIDVIRQIPLFEQVTDDTLAFGLSRRDYRFKSFSKNSVVHFSGEVCEYIEIVVRGRMSLERIDEDGRVMSVAEFFKGDVIGGNLVFSKRPRYPMTITAKETTEVFIVEKNSLFELLCKNEEVLASFLTFISDNAILLGNKIRNDVNRSIRDIIMRFLEVESKRQNSSRIRLSMSKKALADKIGVQRTSLSRELSRMRDDGLITFDAHYIERLAPKD